MHLVVAPCHRQAHNPENNAVDRGQVRTSSSGGSIRILVQGMPSKNFHIQIGKTI